MNEQELQNVLNKLTVQAETIRKKQDIGKQIEKIDGWVKALEEKAAEIVALGATPAVDVEEKIAALKAEREDLQSMLTPASVQAIQSLVAPPTWKEPISEVEAKEMAGMLQVMDTLDMSAWSQEERWYQYDAWACRWRLLVNAYPKDVVDRSPLLKQVYGKIRDLMKAGERLLWYIQALDRSANVDWMARLAECEKAIELLSAERKDREIYKENSQELQVWTLMATVREFEAIKGEEFRADAEKKLRHQVRSAAKHKHLREEVAGIVTPLKALLQEEFGFLWPKTEVEEAVPTRSMNTRDLVARLMRRMKAKTLIGACHGPFEQIYKGFPEQDKGRAKEMLQLLGKLGVIRFKDSVIGTRVSIEPKQMPLVDHLIKGEDTGDPTIDILLDREVRV